MPHAPKLSAIAERQDRQKAALLEHLRKSPIIQIACERTGIGRATYYRWKQEDEAFAAAADQAVIDGASLINDMAESQLLAAIRDRNLTAIIFWLKHHHPAYEHRVKLSGTLHHVTDELTDDQATLVRQALMNAGLLSGDHHD